MTWTIPIAADIVVEAETLVEADEAALAMVKAGIKAAGASAGLWFRRDK